MLLGGGGVQGALNDLGAHPDDWLFRVAIINRAQQLSMDRRKAEIEAEATLFGNRVAEVVMKSLRAALG